MHAWHLQKGDPLNLVLAADARLSEPDYHSDNIWQIKLGQENSPALMIETTLGLRATCMQLFPVFLKGFQSIIDPLDYSIPPEVVQIYPNYAHIESQPLTGVDASFEYWVLSSHSLAGRVSITNSTSEQLDLDFIWAGVMIPFGPGEKMKIERQGLNWLLQGITQGLTATCFLAGGARPGSGIYPGLQLHVQLAPGESHLYQWAFSTRGGKDDSLKQCKELCALDWESEISRIENLNRSQLISIDSGNPDWDAALMLSQVAAFRLIMPAGDGLPSPSFVQNRLPDEGFSSRSAGNDYLYLWRGQSALESWYLSSIVLGNPEIGRGLVDNFIHMQDGNGFIAFQPGLAGRRSAMLAQPLIAVIAEEVFSQTGDREWLRAIFPHLLDFYRSWFNRENDKDQDGFPEWAHTRQTGLEPAPFFDQMVSGLMTIVTQNREGPDLAAYLIREGQALSHMARDLGLAAESQFVENKIQLLKDHLQHCWDEEKGIYHCRDFETHSIHSGEKIVTLKTNGTHRINTGCDQPRRLIVTFFVKGIISKKIEVIVVGRNGSQKVVAEFHPYPYQFDRGYACTSSQYLFTWIDEIEISGLKPGDSLTFTCMDLLAEDITGLLPLWAGVPTPLQAKKMVAVLQKRFLKKFGISFIPSSVSNRSRSRQQISRPIWDQLLGEGLLRYGYRREVAELTSRVLNAIVNNLKKENSFRAGYHAASGVGLEERDSLCGLVPVRLFLKTAGIDLLQPQRVAVSGYNPFDLPVVVQYKGMTITREKDRTTVEFSRGERFSTSGESRKMITPNGIQEKGEA